MTGEDLSIIIATLNEEQNIEECLRRIHHTVPSAEILIIHGGKDRTLEIAERFQARTACDLRVIQNYGDSGKGHAIKMGISLATRKTILQFDADLQFLPEEIPRVVEPILLGKADLVIGSRFSKDSHRRIDSRLFVRNLGNYAVNGWVSWLAGEKISDVTSGFKAWSHSAILQIGFKDNRFVYEMEIVLRAFLNGLRVLQVPVTYENRKGGLSGHGKGFQEWGSLIRTGSSIIWNATLLITSNKWGVPRCTSN